MQSATSRGDGLILGHLELMARDLLPLQALDCSDSEKMEVRKMGAIGAWRPFRELERMARRWESFPRFFEDFEDNYDEAFTPAIESYVEKGNLVVRADAPGLELKDIEVTILGNVLSIKGERKNEHEVRKQDYLHREVSYGAFERRMSLPQGTATDKVKATFKNGVLEITLPLAQETVPKRVAIEAGPEKKVEISKK